MRRPSCSGVTKCVGRTDEEVQAIEAHGGACTMSRKRNALPGKARCVRQGRLREGAAVTVRVRRNRLRGDCRNDCRDVLGCLAHASKDETEHAPVLAKARDERADGVRRRVEKLGVERGECILDVLVDAIGAAVRAAPCTPSLARAGVVRRTKLDRLEFEETVCFAQAPAFVLLSQA